MKGLSVHLGKDATCRAKQEADIALRAGITQPGPTANNERDIPQNTPTDVHQHDSHEMEDVVDHAMEDLDLVEDWDSMEGVGLAEGMDTMQDVDAAEGVDIAEVVKDPQIDDDDEGDEYGGEFHDILNHAINHMVAPSEGPAQLDQDLPEQNPSNRPLDGLLPADQPGEFIEPYPEPGAGAPIRAATEAEMRRMEPGDIGELADPENFELADFMFSTGMSVSERERFLNLKKFKGQMPWTTNYRYLKDVDKLPHGPDWKIKSMKLSGKKGTQVMEFHYRDTPDCVRQLLANKQLGQQMHWAPHRHWTSREKKMRRYGDMRKSRWWWATQAKVKDKQATIVPCIIMTDETPLANFCGNKKAHPVYLTIGNIPKDIRRKPSNNATILIGYLPADKITCKTNQEKRRLMRWELFHRCLEDLLQPLLEASKTGIEAVCGDGQVRRIYPFLASYIADFPEQCRIAVIKNTFCPVCTVNPREKGNLNPNIPLRKSREVLDAMQENEDTGSAKFEALGLHEVWPFWTEHSYIDIATLHTPDLLHQLNKGVFKDHLCKWGASIKGKTVVDDRYKVMPEHAGIRHFGAGITEVSRWTGREMKEMAKVFLPVVADCSPRVVEAARALLDFIYLAHASSLTDRDLDAMDAALAKFHELKEVFESAGVLGSEWGFHNIPKIHMMQHYTHSVRMLGTPDGFNSEASERLHIDFAKAGYRASNKVNETAQMTKFMLRTEAFAMHRAYLAEDPHEDDTADVESVINWEDEEVVSPSVRPGVDRRVGEVQEGMGSVEGVGESWVKEFLEGLNEAVLNEAGGNELPIWYPLPLLRISKTHTWHMSASTLAKEHNAPKFCAELAKFIAKRRPSSGRVLIPEDYTFKVWSRFRLFHSPPPYHPLEPASINVIRAKPATIGQYGEVKRTAKFDTVLVKTHPERHGIHRYRAARVHAIFELPSHLREIYPGKLAYVDWFNPFPSKPAKYLDQFQISRAFDPAGHQLSSVIPLSDIHLSCHVAPKFGSVAADVELTLEIDIFRTFWQFYLNDFSSHFMFELMRHWKEQVKSGGRV